MKELFKSLKLLDWLLIIVLTAMFLFSLFLTSDLKSFLETIALFNITFSIGIGTILIAITSLVQKSKIKIEKNEIVKFISIEYPGYFLFNLMLLMIANFNYEGSELVQIIGGIGTHFATIYVLFKMRMFFLQIINKIYQS